MINGCGLAAFGKGVIDGGQADGLGGVPVGGTKGKAGFVEGNLIACREGNGDIAGGLGF